MEAPVSGSYTFYTVSDDGIRLRLDGREIISNWTAHAPTTDTSKPIQLEAGRRYNLELEYFEWGGGATARLQWSYPGQARTFIPKSRLYNSTGTPPPPPLNSAPTVNLTSPAAGATFTAPATVELAANASDSDGTVAKVEFFQGSTKLGEDTASPYTFTWQNVPAGSYSVNAKATDDAGASTTSAAVSVQVTAPPTTGDGNGTGLKGEYFGNSSFAAPVALTRTDATVDFEWGSGAPPGLPNDGFSVRWTGQVEAPVTGDYTFYTVSDDGVRLSISGQKVIENWTDHAPTENSSQSVKLTAGQKYDLRLEFYEGWGGATARLLWAYPGQAKTVIPRSRLYPAVIDELPVNSAPTVSLTSPAAGATFTAPATVELAANASDRDGTVAKVEFFQGSTKLGEDTASPYTFTWQNVPAGSYSVSAKATDNVGAVATSTVASFTVQEPSYVSLPAPTGLAAQGVWSDSCCGGQPMAHIALSWNAVAGAVSYNIYRDGQFYKGEVLTLNFKDMPVPSGETHSYQVAAVNQNGVGQKSNSVSATAPFPPSGKEDPGFTAPTNLRIKGVWLNGPTDLLTWDPVPGAVAYNVYQYDDRILTNVPVPACTVPTSIYASGLTYTVTAITASGRESIPSNIVTAMGAMAPNSGAPGWMPAPPTPPRNVTTTAEWNAGRPRIRVTWITGNNGSATLYNVYRNGQKVAEGLFGLNYIDTAVQPGGEYSYQVTGVNIPWLTPVESGLSAPVTGKAPTSGPAFSSAPVEILRVVPNDDSVIVHFAAVPGAVDYRCYNTAKPGQFKYSGGGLSIEMNGIDPQAGSFLVVEAVDKLGPFQKMDGFMGPGSEHAGMMNVAVNGQGDPSNVPNLLAKSAQFHVTCQPRTLTGSQVFFDTFRNSQPFVPAPVPPVFANLYGPRNMAILENDRWRIYNARGDQLTSKVFVMSSHFMDTFYDGGTPRTGDPTHTNLASLVMQAKPTVDIANGKVLHVTMEVDPHFSPRRWCDIQLAEAGDPLLLPGDFGNSYPTASGNLLRWEIRAQSHNVQLFRGMGGQLNRVDLIDGHHRGGMSARMRFDGLPLSNGTHHDFDKRHRFDLYLSKDRVRIEEDGVLVGDQTFPAGTALPFSKMAVYFVHQVYHTSLERAELVLYSPHETYWINHRPWADERHWDNMGFEVLDRFPE